jgi:excisionase family DNA binding protein
VSATHSNIRSSRDRRAATSTSEERSMTASLVYTADELARMLGIDRKTVYDFASRGVLPCRRLGRRILFPRSAIERWLAETK